MHRVLVGNEELGCTAEFVAVLATRGVSVDREAITHTLGQGASQEAVEGVVAYLNSRWGFCIMRLAHTSHAHTLLRYSRQSCAHVHKGLGAPCKVHTHTCAHTHSRTRASTHTGRHT